MPFSPAPLVIDLSESFRHLPRAPVTEAVLQFQGRALAPWDESSIFSALKTRLSDYPKADSQRTQQITFGGIPEQTPPIVDLGWSGAVLRSADGLQVVNFQRDAFAFSRLAPYQTWNAFSSEALRLYELHLSLARPAEVQRIGLRFINQFDVPTAFELSDYFTQPPSAHAGLPLEPAVFFHQDTFRVPGHPYGVNVIRTFQPVINMGGASVAPKLILDIDVFTETPMLIDLAEIRNRLSEMRWIKNKVFFGSLTPTAQNSFQ